MPTSDAQLLTAMRSLRRAVSDDAERRLACWQGDIALPSFATSAANLAHYLAFRHHDLRALQRELMRRGLSSLGRLESRVLVTLGAVEAALTALVSAAQRMPSGRRPPTRSSPAKRSCRRMPTPCWVARAMRRSASW